MPTIDSTFQALPIHIWLNVSKFGLLWLSYPCVSLFSDLLMYALKRVCASNDVYVKDFGLPSLDFDWRPKYSIEKVWIKSASFTCTVVLNYFHAPLLINFAPTIPPYFSQLKFLRFHITISNHGAPNKLDGLLIKYFKWPWIDLSNYWNNFMTKPTKMT